MKSLFLLNLENLIRNEKESYILEKNKFSRNRETSFEDFVYYVLGNKGKTIVLELDEFFNIRNRGNTVSISKQNLSKQRSYLSPLIFKDTIKNIFKECYSLDKYELEDFKGYKVFAVDGSQLELPNTVQTKEEFKVPLRALKETDTPKARISILYDVKNDYIIDSTISSMSTDELTLAFENIENASQIIDLKK